MNINSVYFTEKEVGLGNHFRLIEFLIEQAYAESSEYFNDIRIIPVDVGAIEVQWVQVPWDKSFGGSFEYVDEDEFVCKELLLPDNTIELVPHDEVKGYLDDWIKEHEMVCDQSVSSESGTECDE